MTTQSEIDTILSEFDVLLVKLHGFREVIAIAPPDGLKALHEEWLKLYQLGDDVSYLAERLDLDYQRQFAEQEGRDETPTDDDDSELDDELCGHEDTYVDERTGATTCALCGAVHDADGFWIH